MKSISIKRFFCACFLLLGINYGSFAQEVPTPDSLGLPGDNLNLFAVMKIFRESETLEVFEKKLNDEGNRINNLDLNGDNQVDYIRVLDQVNGSTHNIILQVPVNEKEIQDVAVFFVDKNEKGEVQIQLVGDEDLYGKDYVIEPNYSEETNGTPNPGYAKTGTKKYTDKEGNVTIVNNYSTYQTADWPCVRYMFAPGYIVWTSPWSWYYYPNYWRPWRPWYWHQYRRYHYHWNSYYYRDYRHCHYYRVPRARDRYYGGVRTVSAIVIVGRKEGRYNNTYGKPETSKMGSDVFFKDKKIRNGLTPAGKEAGNKNGLKQAAPSKSKLQKDIKMNQEEFDKKKAPAPKTRELEKTQPQLRNKEVKSRSFSEKQIRPKSNLQKKEINMKKGKDRH